MRLDELLKAASDGIDGDEQEWLKAMCDGVITLLGVGFPCGYEAPSVEDAREVNRGGKTGVAIHWLDMDMTPDEARGIAAALLRAADEAEATGLR